jgi:endonuclease/exonuclease/phosphatase family metal-dependent hydrolase
MQRVWIRILLMVLFWLLLFGVFQLYQNSTAPQLPPNQQTITPGGPARSEYLLCFWNVENFFDDKDDHRTGPGDREYDKWFAEHPDILRQKLDHLTKALLALNDGKGPDILAIAEVESVRAAELLQQALNKGLVERGVAAAWQYQHVLMKPVSAGRHIAPAILTRLPVIQDRTRLINNRLRILEGRVVVDEQELILFVAHWTSQLGGKESEGRRDEYADKIYGAANAIFISHPAADFLICGDFNETPQAEAITKHLHATGDWRAVRASDKLLLYNLMANKDPAAGFGTLYYKHWLIYDHILVSPGLLDERGWSCEPDSVKVVNTLHKESDRQRRPWRFGSEHDKGPRGYSDHFPVTVRLRLHRN